MKLTEAERLAQELLEQMRPHCERVEIAGSIRRRKPEVKDIEIVCLPRWEEHPDPSDLFGAPVPVNRLYTDWALDSGVRWIKAGTPEIRDWRLDPNGSYWRGLLPEGDSEGVKLDLFLARKAPTNFGLIYLIRTGSAEFSEAVVTHAKRIGRPSAGGYLRDRQGQPIPTPTERDVFRLLGLQWVEPAARTGWSALRAAPRDAREGGR